MFLLKNVSSVPQSEPIGTQNNAVLVKVKVEIYGGNKVL